MNNQQIEIVQLFEQSGLEPEKIARELNLAEGAVKAVLLQFSSVYKKASRKLSNDTAFISEEILRELYDRQIYLAQFAENEAVRLKAQQYLIDSAHGRKDVELKKLEADNAKQSGATINIAKLNILVQRATEQKEKSLNPRPPLELELTEKAA